MALDTSAIFIFIFVAASLHPYVFAYFLLPTAFNFELTGFIIKKMFLLATEMLQILETDY